MEKKYQTPEIEEEKIEIEDIIAASGGSFGGSQPGDFEGPFFKK